MGRVLFGKTLWNEDVHRSSEKLLATITEQLFDVSVHQDDATSIVHEDDTAWGSFRRDAKQILCLLLRRYVHRDAAERNSFAAHSTHTASARFHPTYTAVRKYEAILGSIILTALDRVLERLLDSITIIDMHKGNKVLGCDFSGCRQPEKSTAHIGGPHLISIQVPVPHPEVGRIGRQTHPLLAFAQSLLLIDQLSDVQA